MTDTTHPHLFPRHDVADKIAELYDCQTQAGVLLVQHQKRLRGHATGLENHSGILAEHTKQITNHGLQLARIEVKIGFAAVLGSLVGGGLVSLAARLWGG